MRARSFIGQHYNKMRQKAIVKRLQIRKLLLLGMLVGFSLLRPVFVWADDDPAVSGAKELVTTKTEQAAPEKAEPMVPKSELDNLKAEWEAVREQQIQMIREKEDQLEKLKEEIFSRMKALNAPAVPQPALSAAGAVVAAPENSRELEAQKASLKAERQKFFQEMNRQKESLRKLQALLDEKAKQLDAERERFEQGKLTAGR